MPFGSDTERLQHRHECETTEEIRRLFERYRAEARQYADLTGEYEPMIVPTDDEPSEPLVTTP